MTYPTTTRLLSLDMASVCGWALLGGGVLTSGSRDFRRGKSHAHPGAPHAMFSNWLRETITTTSPDAVIYEDAGFFKSADAVQICVGMRGVMLAETAKRGVQIFGYAPSSVKLFFTGSGKSDKAAMMREYLRRYPDSQLVDSNEADAVALLLLHLSKTGVESLALEGVAT